MAKSDETIPAERAMTTDYRLIRSRKRKKTITLALTREGQVVVRAPYGVPVAEIASFVEQKKSWLNRKMAEFQVLPKQFLATPLMPEDGVLYLGMAYPLFVVESEQGGKDTLQWSGKAFQLRCRNLAVGKALLVDWYQKQAKNLFPARVTHFSSLMGVVPSSLRVSPARYRYGSCSVCKRISLSWRLMMAPWAVIDSVIIHELAHLREMNHSHRFWSFVRLYCPDYEQHKTWLRTNGHRLAHL